MLISKIIISILITQFLLSVRSRKIKNFFENNEAMNMEASTQKAKDLSSGYKGTLIFDTNISTAIFDLYMESRVFKLLIITQQMLKIIFQNIYKIVNLLRE